MSRRPPRRMRMRAAPPVVRPVSGRPVRSAGAADRLLVIGCGMLAREILQVKERLGLDYMDLTCLPAQYHYRPDLIVPALENAIIDARQAGYGQIFVGYGDCGTGGRLDQVCERHGVARMAGPHCFAFYQGIEAYRRLEDADLLSFYMTDFLCRQFEAFFIRPLALDRHPELARDYFGNYQRLVYLAQTEDAALDAVAEAAARMLGLAYERRQTGYGDLVAGIAGAARGVTARSAS